MRFSKNSHIHGFTLIELLVVVSIITLLSSIILTNLSSARMKADDARIESDVHSMQTALELYYNDHNSYPCQQTNSAATYPDPTAGISITDSGPSLGSWSSCPLSQLLNGYIGFVPDPPDWKPNQTLTQLPLPYFYGYDSLDTKAYSQLHGYTYYMGCGDKPFLSGYLFEVISPHSLPFPPMELYYYSNPSVGVIQANIYCVLSP